MKGVLLAGGTGSRLRPLTNIINKHLLPVGEYPMIHYGICKLKEAGIEDIVLIIGKQSAGLYIDYLGGGSEFGVRLTYKVQERAGGIAEALALASGYMVPGEKFIVLLGDNLFSGSLLPYVHEFNEQPEGAKVILTKVEDARRYGVPVMRNGQIISIIEKPSMPPSDYCVTGIYFYDTKVFELIEASAPSARGEMEITDINNKYAAVGLLTYGLMDGWWTDAGTFESLLEAGAVLREGE
jgi:glucose-1-phosphate thymidylyltransferase